MQSTQIYEGKWEDVAGKVKLAGRNVRIELRGETAFITVSLGTASTARTGTPNPWLMRLVEYANSHEPVRQEIDLDRDRLFGELHD